MTSDPSDDRSTRDRALFDRIAAEYASKDLFPAAALARRVRLAQTLKKMRIGPDAEILELGCGAGFAARYLQGSYRTYTGVDYSETLIRYAQNENAVPGAEFHMADIQHFNPGREFDAVFMIGVLHHMPDMPKGLECAIRLTRPGGSVAVNEPQPSNPIVRASRWIRAHIDRHYSAEQVQLSAEQIVAMFAGVGSIDVETFAQGFFSTPFAEVVVKPAFIALPLSQAACGIDLFLERPHLRSLRRWAWNVIVTGRRPEQANHGNCRAQQAD